MSYRDLLNKKYSLKLYYIIFLGVFLSLLIYVCNQKVMNIYDTTGYVFNNKVIFHIPIEDPDTINKLEYISINNYKYYLSDISISEILFDEINIINYQEITLELNDTIKDNMLIKVRIYYNEETVLQKLKNLMF